MSRKVHFFIYKPFYQGIEIDLEIVDGLHRWLIDFDLPSQICWGSNDHHITIGAVDGFFQISHLIF
jgi:hypothetical protein